MYIHTNIHSDDSTYFNDTHKSISVKGSLLNYDPL